MRTTSVPGVLSLTALVIGGLIFTGCSKSDSEKVSGAVTGYLSAFAEGDGEAACEYLTTAGRLELVELYVTNLGGFGTQTAQCPVAVEEIAANVGADGLAALEDADVEVTVSGDQAFATPSSGGNEGNEITLEKVNGEWLISGGFIEG